MTSTLLIYEDSTTFFVSLSRPSPRSRCATDMVVVQPIFMPHWQTLSRQLFLVYFYRLDAIIKVFFGIVGIRMNYIILILLSLITLFLHWHYYWWCIFNMKMNRPKIYRSYIGDILVHGSTVIIVLFIIIFFKWYFVVIPFVVFGVMKNIAYRTELRSLTGEYMSQEHLSKTKAIEVAKSTIEGYSRSL